MRIAVADQRVRIASRPHCAIIPHQRAGSPEEHTPRCGARLDAQSRRLGSRGSIGADRRSEVSVLEIDPTANAKEDLKIAILLFLEIQLFNSSVDVVTNVTLS